MSRRGISYARNYEHSDFGDLLSELHGESENTAIVDGALALAIPSPIVPVSANEESEERHRIMSDQKIKYLYSRQESIIHDKHCSCAKYIPDEERR